MKKGREIPAFGNWENVIQNDLPITQYFESATQAGLLRYSSSSASGNCDTHLSHSAHLRHHNHHASTRPNPPGREKRGGMQGKEGGRKQAGRVFNVTVTDLPPPAAGKRYPAKVTAVKKQQHQQFQHEHRRAPKAVDEDLYKIPPELLKRKKRLGFFSRCLVPPCAV